MKPILAYSGCTLLVAVLGACDKKEPAAASTATSAASATAIVWPGKKDSDVLLGSINELSKEGACTLVVLQEERASPAYIEVTKKFFSQLSHGAFVEKQTCPTNPHLTGMCSAQQTGYTVFYTSGGGKSWTKAEAKAGCEKGANSVWLEP
jgi:hypothetical protein